MERVPDENKPPKDNDRCYPRFHGPDAYCLPCSDPDMGIRGFTLEEAEDNNWICPDCGGQMGEN